MEQQDIIGRCEDASFSTTTEVFGHAGRKRKLPPNANASTIRGAYPRKRAFAACEMCRARKTKCDNTRPTCGSCQQIRSTCRYPDPSTDHSSFDPASLAILNRLNYLIGIVESERIVQAHGLSNSAAAPQSSDFSGSDSIHDSTDACLAPNLNPFGNGQVSTNTHIPAPRTWPKNGADTFSLPHIFYGSSEDILDWSVFHSKHDREHIERLIFDETLHLDAEGGFQQVQSRSPDTSPRSTTTESRSNPSFGHGIREEDVPDLVESFLANVHTKNPIFDADVLRGIAKPIAGEGFGWDARTCLVLLTCACAVISQPFVHIAITDCAISDSLVDTPHYAKAEAYYDAARKRIGLLTNTQLATECYFLAGVYEMYSLRPLRASISFNRACVAFQALTWMRSEHCLNENRLERAQTSRLYWSCLKSENEIMVELRFPASGLTTLNYTQSFPLPPGMPTVSKSPKARRTSEDPRDRTSPSLEPELERTWYYYLADIAVRRILQRVFDIFYRSSHHSWPQQDISHLIWSAEELDQQLTQWYNNLPQPVAFHDGSFADEELSFHLQARFAEVKERIYRPFLYMAIHHPEAVGEQGLRRHLVQKHIHACLRLIRHWNVTHRHHGTWLMVRQSFTAGLLLVAAHRSGLTVGEISDVDFAGIMQTCIATLRYWEREAPDLRASRLILEDMTAEPFS